MRNSAIVLALAVVAWGCGSKDTVVRVAASDRVIEPRFDARSTQEVSPDGATSDAPDPVTAPPTEDAAAAALAAVLPTSCTSVRDCVPPKEFTAAACHGRFPSMALAMFEKRTPWQRLYLKAESLEAVNAYGNRAVASPLSFGEEVIVLRGVAQPKAGKFQISSSDIDVLRWDGTCATVAREYFSTTRMEEVTQATIPWRYLEDSFQQTLLSSKVVATLHAKLRTVCKGSRSTSADAECQKAASKLSDAIGIAVRGGLDLPKPAHLPAWATREYLDKQGEVAMNSSDDDS